MAVHQHRWRARKPCLVGCGLVDDQGAVQVRVDAEFIPDPLHQGQRLPVVGQSWTYSTSMTGRRLG